MRAVFRLAILAFTGLSLLGQSEPRRAQLRFAPGGQVTMNLEAGDYDIAPGAADWIVVSWEPGDARSPKVLLEGTGPRASLSIRHTPRHQFHARIELPARCDLKVRMSAGNLRVGPLEGNKDLSLRAGDLRVDIPHPEQYGPVHASLWAGNIQAGAFGVDKDGLFRSFDGRGPGTYTLQVSLWAGDITLRRTGAPKP